jgi:hypothetical protein
MRAQEATYQQIADVLNRESFALPTGQGQWKPGTV